MFNEYIGKRIANITHYKCTLSVCTLLQSTLSANKIPHGRQRKTFTYTFLLITACFCCYLKTSCLIKYPACSHPSPVKSTIGYKSSQANNKILNKLDSNLDSNFRIFDEITSFQVTTKQAASNRKVYVIILRFLLCAQHDLQRCKWTTCICNV